MALVDINGVFMGASVKTSTYEGKSSSSLYIDVYQADSDLTDKMVQIKSDDVGLINNLTKDYAMGSVFSCKATVNAYKNKAYFKLLKIA